MSSSPAQPSGQNPSFKSEMSRLLSFPDSMNFVERRAMAAGGLYWEAGRARCNFCSDVSEKHDCPLVDNIPLGGDNLRHEADRLLSFLAANWPQMPSASHPVGCRDLARWGFFYTGNADAARCAFCRLEVRGWEQGDTAEAEHRRWNPQCAFLQGRAVGNVPLGEEGQDNVTTDAIAFIEVIPGEGVHAFHQARHPSYTIPANRQRSFAMWPVSLRQRPELLNVAGFFYTGSGDRVVCYQCGGGLKDWGPQDDPWTEHALHFPSCMHIGMQRGHHVAWQAFIAQLRADRNSQAAAPRHLQEEDPQLHCHEMSDDEISTAMAMHSLAPEEGGDFKSTLGLSL